MTNCTQYPIQFPSIKNKKVLANFLGGDISSDGGILLLRKIDQKLKLTASLAKSFSDRRAPGKIDHTILQMLRQRVYGIAAGYEDLNDHDSLKDDLAMQTAVGKESALASSPTLCRFENSFSRKEAILVHQALFESFIQSFPSPPKKLILDFDATDIPIHGNQESKAFHGYYDHDCFLPLHVFCKEKLLVSYLRKSNEDQAKHTWAIFALLYRYLKKVWPEAEINFRGDGGFCRPCFLEWLDRNKIGYIIGATCNARLKKALEPYLAEAKKNYEAVGGVQQVFAQFAYRAGSWKRPRKVIGKAECSAVKEQCRVIVTNLEGEKEDLYKQQYCPRGNMENKIKEQFLLFSDRTSAHRWWPNQFRLLLSALAYVLIEHLRSGYLKNTKWAQAQVDTIRLKLFKIGAVIFKNTRKILFNLSSSYPDQDLFHNLAAVMNSS